MPFVPAIDPPEGASGDALWCLFQGDRLLVDTSAGGAAIPRVDGPGALGMVPVRTQFLGTLDGVPCFTGEVEEAAAPPGTEWRSLRPLLGVLDDERFGLAGRAFQVMDWDRGSRYCGRCGRATEPVPRERARACPGCGTHFYPRVTPAVIVAVTRGRTLLLARASRFPQAFHSVLAGFVEPGETLEECIHREIREEAGIGVRNLRYFGSQSWPFPHSLMVGFTAEHAEGEIAVDGTELVSADWYPPAGIASLAIPRVGSISRRLIDDFLAGG
jgi:NAD+ diphosphatase